MIRLFVGIALPEDVRARLAALCAGVPCARWIDPDNLHLTLRFAGEVDMTTADDIHDALDGLSARRFDIVVAGVGHFETAGQVHTLWAGVEKNRELTALRDRVEGAMVRVGLKPESRRFFRPHVTLGRIKGGPLGRISAFVVQHERFRAGPIGVGQFTLFSSVLRSEGSLYRVEADYPLRRIEAVAS